LLGYVRDQLDDAELRPM